MKLLHVGPGSEERPHWFEAYEEVRLDISPDHQPDVLASMTEMGDIGPFDAVYSSHSLEHLAPYEVPVALDEFYRVLNPGGFALIIVPDLEDIRPTEDVLYMSPAGPITGLDLIYGAHYLLKQQPYMAHQCGFVAATLEGALRTAGFSDVKTQRLSQYNLMAVATK